MSGREPTDAELSELFATGNEVATLRLKRLQTFTWILAALVFGVWLFWARAQGGTLDLATWFAALLLVLAAGLLRREVRRRDRAAMAADLPQLEREQPPK